MRNTALPGLTSMVAALFAITLMHCSEGPVQSSEHSTICPQWPQPSDDPSNPGYKVVSPNGGEKFRVGDKCTVRIGSRLEGEVDIRIGFGAGNSSFRLPGLPDGNMDPKTDSIIEFTIPEYFMQTAPNAADPTKIDTVKFSTISDSCFIHLVDYNFPGDYFDFSDCYFTIQP